MKLIVVMQGRRRVGVHPGRRLSQGFLASGCVGPRCDTGHMARESRMVSLGFGKYARSDRIYALVPLAKEERGGGRRTRVWVEGIAEPVIASRTEVTILRDMGQEAAV